MKRPVTPFFALLFASTLLAGCGTLFSGTSDDITFSSQPEGADIYIDGAKRGTTPATVNVDRDAFSDVYATLRMEGYEDRRIKLKKDFTTVSILNLGNVLFWGIDAATGAMMNYSVRNYDVELDRGESAHFLKELPRDEQGAYIIPDADKSISITDRENGVQIVFSKGNQ